MYMLQERLVGMEMAAEAGSAQSFLSVPTAARVELFVFVFVIVTVYAEGQCSNLFPREGVWAR